MRFNSRRIPLFRSRHEHFLISIQAQNFDSLSDHSELYLRYIEFELYASNVLHLCTIFINHDLSLVLRIQRYNKVIYLNKELENTSQLINDFRNWFQHQTSN